MKRLTSRKAPRSEGCQKRFEEGSAWAVGGGQGGTVPKFSNLDVFGIIFSEMIDYKSFHIHALRLYYETTDVTNISTKVFTLLVL